MDEAERATIGLGMVPSAYLDPGSGSMLLQALVGGAAAAAVVGKLYWRRLRNLLRVGKRDGERQ